MKIKLLLIGVFFLVSCKKSVDVSPIYAANVTVINATSDASGFYVKYDDDKIIYSKATRQTYYFYNGSFDGPYRNYGLRVGASSRLAIINERDTSQIMLQQTFNSFPGDNYSLYVLGNLTNPESLIVRENFPDASFDVASIRFINLCPNLEAIDVNISAVSPRLLFSSLKYKESSQFYRFKDYGATNNLNLEFVNHKTKEIIGNYSFSPYENRLPFSKNITLIVRGMDGNNYPGININRINNN